MDLGVRFIDVLFPFAAFLFPFWPLMFLVALRARRNIIPAILILWFPFLVLRVILIFSPLPTVDFLIPEPLNTYIFVGSGIFLAAGYALWIARRRSD
jgi:hypothetical protein